jgi:hypothetical protein
MSRSRQQAAEGKAPVPSKNPESIEPVEPTETEAPAQQESQGEAESKPKPAQPTRKPRPVTTLGPAARSSTPGPQTTTPGPRAPEPILRTGDGRIRLSLNYVSVTVAISALVLVMIGVFVLGRKTAPSDAAGVVKGSFAAIETWSPSRNYLILAEVGGDSRTVDARAAKLQFYLYENGLTSAVERASGRILLAGFKGFADPQSGEAREFEKRVASLVSQAPIEDVKPLPGRDRGPGPWWIDPGR